MVFLRSIIFLSHQKALIASAITGGIPSLDPSPQQVYKFTLQKVRQKNEEFFTRYPHLQQRVDRIADLLAAEEIYLPDGDRLTVR